MILHLRKGSVLVHITEIISFIKSPALYYLVAEQLLPKERKLGGFTGAGNWGKFNEIEPLAKVKRIF